MNQKINVGLIGFGMAGRVFHAPLIKSINNYQLTKILKRNPEISQKEREKYSEVEVVTDLNKLLADKEIDLVVVATPNKTHFDFARKSLLADKHVVVEKPFTVTSQEADELIELAKEKNKLLSVYQNRRFDSDFLTVKQVINNNLLGNLVEYEARFDRFRNYFKDKWKEKDLPGSGILYDLGAHLIDQSLSLFGLPKEVRADIRIQRTGGVVDDYFELILGYDKLKVTLKAGMLVREKGPHFILKGEKGSFVKCGMDPQEEALSKGELPPKADDWGVEPEEIWGILNTELEGMHFRGKLESETGDYRIFYKNIAQAILQGAELKVKPEEAREVIRIIELAKESNQAKRTIKV